MSFRIERNSITKVSCDAIVNTANPQPVVGRGTDTVIYEAAGLNDLLALRREIGVIERGHSEWTPALNLEKQGIKYIIHTVGVPYGDGKSGQVDILRSCYSTSLNLALELPLDQFEEFLATAGYAIMPSRKFDLIVKYCVINQIYNLVKVDVLLNDHGLNCFHSY